MTSSRSNPPGSASPFLALRDRALAALVAHGPLAEAMLLEHVYGGRPPAAMHAQLAAPLLGDSRLERRADGCWATRLAPSIDLQQPLAYSVLALATTGPTPGRAGIVHLSVLEVAATGVRSRFSATLHPGRRVPAYVAARLELDTAVLDDLPPFESIAHDLVRFFDTRPVFAQDARLAWAFLEAEVRRTGEVLAPTLLLDVNELCTSLLELPSKPTLARVAQHLGIAAGRVAHPDEEARVLAQVVPRLLDAASQHGAPLLLSPSAAHVEAEPLAQRPLRRGETARALPDRPGIYVLRDAGESALYVGKARRLRSRVESYVFRPLGPTRRLEGLVDRVTAVEAAECETDLEALVLEDREIRRLQPRFNTVRRQHEPRTWLRLPPPPAPRRGTRQPALRRIELARARAADGADYFGPFRNEALAEQARELARAVFDLDKLRRGEPYQYVQRLLAAWSALTSGDASGQATMLGVLRERQQQAAAMGNRPAVARCARLLEQVRAYDPASLLLPADPRQARYAVVRPGPAGPEVFVVDQAVCTAYATLGHADDDPQQFAADLLRQSSPRTSADDGHVVLRWLGAQRPSARLVHLPSDALLAAEAIDDALLALLADGEA